MEIQQIDFLLALNKEALSLISELDQKMKHFGFYKEIDRLRVFLQVQKVFHQLLFNTVLLYKNKHIEQQINFGN